MRTSAARCGVFLLVSFAGCIPRTRDGSEDGPVRRGSGDGPPIAVVRAYAEAWRDGDGQRFLSLVHARDDRERQALEAFTELMTTTPKLRRAAERRFGADGAERVVGRFVPPTDTSGSQMLDSLDDEASDVEVEVTGDRASVGIEPVGEIELLRIAGRWKIVLEDPGEVDEQQVQLFRQLASAQRRLARDVEAGRYRSVEQAERALLDYHPQRTSEDERG